MHTYICKVKDKTGLITHGLRIASGQFYQKSEPAHPVIDSPVTRPYFARLHRCMGRRLVRTGVCRPRDTIELTATIVHFKRLGSRHIHKEIEIS